MEEQARRYLLLISSEIEGDTLAAIESYCKSQDIAVPDRLNLGDWLEAPESGVRLLCLLSDAEIRLLLSHPGVEDWEIAVLPLKNNRNAQASFGVPSNLTAALKGALEMEKITPIDLLTCNGQVVLGTLITGDVWGLHSSRAEEMFWRRVKETLSHLGSLRLRAYTLTTGKGQEQELAAMGVMVFGHNFAGSSTTAVDETIIPNDGKLTAFVLSPTSVVGHLWFLLKLRLLRRVSLQQLPNSVGFIRTNALTIGSNKPLEATLDGDKIQAGSLLVEVKEKAANVILGKKAQPGEEESGSNRESLRTTHLPSLAASRMLREKSLPLFPHAAEADFRELFLNLRDSAKMSTTFAVLMILSTLLASTGLFLNSASVIIGAMILAPLMSPIISLSMGIVRTDNGLIQTSLKTLLTGLFMALFFAAFFALLMPLQTITNEMDGRLHPSLLDLLVALLSGVAGAYANAKEQVAKSLAGVAIAVALVPPLAVTGIGIGWLNLQMVFGASLLFLTNLVGIMLAASVTFLILGFAPVSRARKALLVSVGLMLVISIPLGFTFQSLVRENAIRNALSELSTTHPEDGEMEVRSVFLRGAKPVIRADLRVTGEINEDMIARQKARIEKKLGEPVSVEFSVVYAR